MSLPPACSITLHEVPTSIPMNGSDGSDRRDFAHPPCLNRLCTGDQHTQMYKFCVSKDSYLRHPHNLSSFQARLLANPVLRCCSTCMHGAVVGGGSVFRRALLAVQKEQRQTRASKLGLIACALCGMYPIDSRVNTILEPTLALMSMLSSI